MLTVDPRERISLEDALNHPWLASLHSLNESPTCPEPFTFDFEHVHLDGNTIRELLYREILEFHPTHRFSDQIVVQRESPAQATTTTCGGGGENAARPPPPHHLPEDEGRTMEQQVGGGHGEA